MKKIVLITLFIPIFLASCTKKNYKELIVGEWNLKSIEGFDIYSSGFHNNTKLSTEQLDSIKELYKKDHDATEDLMKLFAESYETLTELKKDVVFTFTTDEVNIPSAKETSKWEISGDSLIFIGFTNLNGARFSIYISKLNDTKLSLQTNKFLNKPLILNFEKKETTVVSNNQSNSDDEISAEIIKKSFSNAWNKYYGNKLHWRIKEINVGEIKKSSEGKKAIVSIKFTFISGGGVENTKMGDFTFRKFDNSWEADKDEIEMLVGR